MNRFDYLAARQEVRLLDPRYKPIVELFEKATRVYLPRPVHELRQHIGYPDRLGTLFAAVAMIQQVDYDLLDWIVPRLMDEKSDDLQHWINVAQATLGSGAGELVKALVEDIPTMEEDRLDDLERLLARKAKLQPSLCDAALLERAKEAIAARKKRET